LIEQMTSQRTYEGRNLSADFKKKYIISLKGKDHILFKGLVQLGHAKGMKGLKTKIVYYPDQSNNFTAVAESCLIDTDGNEWSDIGDATPANCNNMVAPHFIRMASTRAKARVLRDFLGIDMVCFEELLSPWEQKPLTVLQKQYMSEIMTKKGLSGEQVRALSISLCHKNDASKLTEEDGWDIISHIERLPNASAQTPVPTQETTPVSPMINQTAPLEPSIPAIQEPA